MQGYTSRIKFRPQWRGWIDGFIHEVSKQANVVLGVCCLGGGVWGKKYHSGIVSYPFLPKLDFFGKFKKLFSPSMEEEIALPYIKKAIDDFSPDIIHIFGSDNFMGVICGETEVPCIIHIQGFYQPMKMQNAPLVFVQKTFYPHLYSIPLRIIDSGILIKFSAIVPNMKSISLPTVITLWGGLNGIVLYHPFLPLVQNIGIALKSFVVFFMQTRGNGIHMIEAR